MESQSATINNARIFTVRSEPVGKLTGFEKHHKIPTSVNPGVLVWVEQLTMGELNRDLQEVVDLLRVNFGFKRRQLDIHGPEDRRGVIETPFFNYEISVDLDREDPAWVVWRREINHIRDVHQVFGEAFLNCFAKAAWRLEIAWNREINLTDLIDRIEDLESPQFRVDYGKDLTWCRVSRSGTNSKLLISNGTFEISRDATVSPCELIEDLIGFQSQLFDKIDSPGIGHSLDASPDN
jgi:hypothetical protein